MALNTVHDALALPRGTLILTIDFGSVSLQGELPVDEQRTGEAFLILEKHGDLEGLEDQAALIKRRCASYPLEEPPDDGPGIATIDEALALPPGNLRLPLNSHWRDKSSFDEAELRRAFDLLRLLGDTRGLFTQAAIVRRYLMKYGSGTF